MRMIFESVPTPSLPMRMLLLPVVLNTRAYLPLAVLPDPVVLLYIA